MQRGQVFGNALVSSCFSTDCKEIDRRRRAVQVRGSGPLALPGPAAGVRAPLSLAIRALGSTPSYPAVICKICVSPYCPLAATLAADLTKRDTASRTRELVEWSLAFSASL